ncbi:MAG: ferredoxin, partial [Clostridia bacterium]|nr:ferredoxin [Clostridia bacterium]
PMETLRLDADFTEALKKMDRIEEIHKKLPGLDCGSCGSPTCQALAEDIVGGYAKEMDCLFLLKEQITLMARQMVEISELTREKNT